MRLSLSQSMERVLTSIIETQQLPSYAPEKRKFPCVQGLEFSQSKFFVGQGKSADNLAA